MKNHAISFVVAVLGLGCAVFLMWMWRQDRAAALTSAAATSGRRPTVAAAIPATPDVTPVRPTIAPEAPLPRGLLASLRQSLLRSDVRAGETVLTFKDDAALARFLARAAKSGLSVTGQLGGLRTVRVHYDDLKALENEITQNGGDLADASANFLVGIPQAPSKENRAAIDQVPFGNDTLAFIGVTGDHSQWGRGTTIAVLDTGIAADATFGGDRLRAIDIGMGVAPGRGADDGHGTSVASLAGGLATDAAGVAPGTNLLSIRVTDANGTSDIFTIAQAIVTAVDAGAQVINVSLGGYGTNAALENAIAYATAHGSVIVAAAGNDQAAQLAWPAADPRVVSVGAVDKAEQQVIFSNSGPQLQLTAPGYGVQTAWTDGQRAYVDGTSASAPLVSGAIAALLSQFPGITPPQAVQLLVRTASDAGPPGADPAYGNGILNVGWAMNSGNPDYVDTAVASHYFDHAANQMDFVVQNRSGRAMTGLSLGVSAGVETNNYVLPGLGAGESYIVKVPVDSAALRNSGRIPFTTTLINPTGIIDQVPRNNRRSSVLTAPSGGN
jgi:hypothetical protein